MESMLPGARATLAGAMLLARRAWPQPGSPPWCSTLWTLSKCFLEAGATSQKAWWASGPRDAHCQPTGGETEPERLVAGRAQLPFLLSPPGKAEGTDHHRPGGLHTHCSQLQRPASPRLGSWRTGCVLGACGPAHRRPSRRALTRQGVHGALWGCILTTSSPVPPLLPH